MRWLLLALPLVACLPPPYTGGLREATALACLDIGADAVPVATGVVIAWRFGNRCDHSVRVDLGAATVTGVDRDGVRIPLVAYDPRHEIRALPLGAGDQGGERLEYDPPAPGALAAVEIDLAGVDGDRHRELHLDVAGPGSAP